MGKIYDFSEITNNQVPQAGNFIEAKALTIQGLSQPVISGDIYGAKVFGSVAKGTANERSDFDLLVTLEHEAANTQLRNLFFTIYEETQVAIEPIIINRQFAEKGFHSIDSFFLDHLRKIPTDGNIVGFDPSDILKPSGLSFAKVHEQ